MPIYQFNLESRNDYPYCKGKRYKKEKLTKLETLTGTFGKQHPGGRQFFTRAIARFYNFGSCASKNVPRPLFMCLVRKSKWPPIKQVPAGNGSV